MKEGTWLEPTFVIRRRTQEGWTDKHRNVARKLETNSQGKDPRAFREPVGRWRVHKKAEAKEVEEEKEKEKIRGEVQKKELVEKEQRKDRKPLYGEEDRGKERQERQKERQTPQSETSLGEIWKMALSPCAVGAELALCQRCSRRIAEKDGDDGKGGSSRKFKCKRADAEEIPQRWKQPEIEDRTEMKKEAKLLRCTLLDGSAWSTEKIHEKIQKENAISSLGLSTD